MTRGKHGHSADTRRRIETAEERARVAEEGCVELAAKVAALKARLDEREVAHRAEVKQLRKERNEGASPMVDVVQAENVRLKAERDEARSDYELRTKQWERCFVRLKEHFVSEHGLLEADSLEACMNIIGPFNPDDGEWGQRNIVVDGAMDHLTSSARADGAVFDMDETWGERIRTLQRVRGQRR